MKYTYLFFILLIFGCQNPETNTSTSKGTTSPSNTTTAPTTSKKVAANQLDQIYEDKVIYANGKEEKIPYWHDKDATILFLVRHAEKKTDSDNPDLTAEGRERATNLSIVTRNADVNKVYQSGMKRTFQTALPTLQANATDQEMYDTGKLSELVNKFVTQEKGSRLLVIGHSNTTPVVMNQLLGKDVYKNIPDNEYDNLYVVATKGIGDTKIIEVKY